MEVAVAVVSYFGMIIFAGRSINQLHPLFLQATFRVPTCNAVTVATRPIWGQYATAQ